MPKQSEKHSLFQTKIVKIDTIFQTKPAQKPDPLGPRIPIWPIQGSTPSPESKIDRQTS